MGAYRTSRRGQQTNPEPDPLQEEESILNNIRVNERINAREERERGGDLSSLLSFTILLSLDSIRFVRQWAATYIFLKSR